MMQVRHSDLIAPIRPESLTHFASVYPALIGRKLVDFSPDSVGTFATVFPSDHPDLPGTSGNFPIYRLLPCSPR